MDCPNSSRERILESFGGNLEEGKGGAREGRKAEEKFPLISSILSLRARLRSEFSGIEEDRVLSPSKTKNVVDDDGGTSGVGGNVSPKSSRRVGAAGVSPLERESCVADDAASIAVAAHISRELGATEESGSSLI